MRASILVVLTALTAACGADSMHLEYQSTLNSDVTGMALHAQSRTGHASMRDTTCAIDLANGAVIVDVDLPTDAEIVRDSRDGVVLATTTEGLHQIVDGVWTGEQDIAMAGVRDAVFTADGPVALVESDGLCQVVWTDSDLRVAAPSCEGSLVSDSMGQGVWLTHDGVVSLVEPEGLTEVMDAERIAFDDVSGTLFAASGPVLGAADRDGSVAWSADVGADITSLSTVGGVGAVLVGSDLRFKAVGLDGEALTSQSLPEGATVIGSDNGRDLGLVTGDGNAHFYELAEGGNSVTFTTDTAVENPFQD